jgi:NitT/TauT family transport system substrate-binding protein
MEWVPSGIYSAFYYGRQRGLFEKEGLAVDILPGTGSNFTVDAVQRGEIDFGFASCWATAVGISKGREVISVATFTGKNGFGFFYPADASITSLKDIGPRAIVVSPGSFDTALIPAVFAANSIPDQMKRLNVDPSQKVPTYARGQADIVVSHVAYADPLIQKQRPSKVIRWSDSNFVLPDYCIIASNERVRNEPKLVEAFLRATYEATRLAAIDLDGAAAAAIALNPLLELGTTREQWKLMTSLFFTEDTRRCRHGWHSKEDWTKALRVLKEYGGLEGSIDDQSKFYTNQFVPCTP